MTVSPGMSRVSWRETPKQLLLFVRQNVSLSRNVPRVLQPLELILGNLHNASRNLTKLPSRLSLSRESLADDLHDSAGTHHAGLDCLNVGDLSDGLVDFPAIFQEFIAC